MRFVIEGSKPSNKPLKTFYLTPCAILTCAKCDTTYIPERIQGPAHYACMICGETLLSLESEDDYCEFKRSQALKIQIPKYTGCFTAPGNKPKVHKQRVIKRGA